MKTIEKIVLVNDDYYGSTNRNYLADGWRVKMLKPTKHGTDTWAVLYKEVEDDEETNK